MSMIPQVIATTAFILMVMITDASLRQKKTLQAE